MTSPGADESVRLPFDPAPLLGRCLPPIFDPSSGLTSRQRLVLAAVASAPEVRWQDSEVGGAYGEAAFTVAALVEKTGLTDLLVSAALVSAEDPADPLREGSLRAGNLAVAWHRRPGEPRFFVLLLSAPASPARNRADKAWGIDR